MGKKLGRNDKCLCGSGKKYKKCCLNKIEQELEKERNKYSYGHEIKSEKTQMCIDYLKNEYNDHKIIDISDYLRSNTYKLIQLKNFKEKIIMVAQRQENNESVFTTRGPEHIDVLIMYHGSYLCVDTSKFDGYKKHIDKMIEERMNA